MSGEKTENTERYCIDYRYLAECERTCFRYMLLELLIGFTMGIIPGIPLIPDVLKVFLLWVFTILSIIPFYMLTPIKLNQRGGRDG